MRIYQVWIYGFPLTDNLMYWDQALSSFRFYKEEGYKDVKIVDTTNKEK